MDVFDTTVTVTLMDRGSALLIELKIRASMARADNLIVPEQTPTELTLEPG